MKLIPLVVVVVSVITKVKCMSSGAPLGACNLMKPNHGGIRPVTAPFPNDIIVPKTVQRGEKIKISVVGDVHFKGYFIYAKYVKGPRDFLGTFAAKGGSQTRDCRLGQAVTHTRPNPKTAINLEWTAPDDLAVGQKIQFVGSYAERYDTFWSNQKSSPISVV